MRCELPYSVKIGLTDTLVSNDDVFYFHLGEAVIKANSKWNVKTKYFLRTQPQIVGTIQCAHRCYRSYITVF